MWFASMDKQSVVWHMNDINYFGNDCDRFPPIQLTASQMPISMQISFEANWTKAKKEMSFIILSNDKAIWMGKWVFCSVSPFVGQIYSAMYGRDQIGVASRQHQRQVQCSSEANICKCRILQYIFQVLVRAQRAERIYIEYNRMCARYTWNF